MRRCRILLKFIGRRVIFMVLSLFVIITITFFMMNLAPGNPFASERDVPDEIEKNLNAYYGLDKPWYQQYADYLVSVLKWDLGPSFKYESQTVNDIINQGFPVSLALGVEALLIALAVGFLLGVLAALKQNKWQDYGAMIFAVLGISIPSFILASLLQYWLAIRMGWFPVSRWGTFAQSVLPAFSLAAMPMAYIARLTRSSMLEVLSNDYIRTARSKGLGEWTVIFRHTLRNALLPVVSYVGPLTASIITGSFIVENIFSIPGLGTHFVTSITNRDYTVIMGVTVFYSILLLVSILIVDLIYGLIDPRINLAGEKRGG